MGLHCIPLGSEVEWGARRQLALLSQQIRSAPLFAWFLFQICTPWTLIESTFLESKKYGNNAYKSVATDRQEKLLHWVTELAKQAQSHRCSCVWTWWCSQICPREDGHFCLLVCLFVFLNIPTERREGMWGRSPHAPCGPSAFWALTILGGSVGRVGSGVPGLILPLTCLVPWVKHLIFLTSVSLYVRWRGWQGDC